ncbi:cytidine deaminase-like protein [Auricularia subglabra TFB-10046 SS5]|nr:cytidine deaminase-like protein [Auricularia subglabra TFB-10046 SS5]
MLLPLGLIFAGCFVVSFGADIQNVLPQAHLRINSIPFSTRAHWMRLANAAVGPCAFGAFGALVVNHTAPGLGELVCIGANVRTQLGDPTLHGEIVAIQNCSRIMTDPAGPFKMTGAQALAAFSQLSLYTNAESCPMCASAIRWSGFREYIYGTSIDNLIALGWGQIRIPSIEIFRQSFDLPNAARILGNVLVNETDPLFAWQFNPDAPCPAGCVRSENGASCLPP